MINMGIFTKTKKEDDKLLRPSLPPLPDLPLFPELPEKEEDSSISISSSLPALPSPPRSSFNNDLSKIPNRPIPMSPMKPVTLEPLPKLKPVTMEISEASSVSYPSAAKVKEPVFVKIEKYKDAISSLEAIKKKMQETLGLIDSIRETRAKEDEELNQWISEVESIKEKIDTIDQKLFSNLEY